MVRAPFYDKSGIKKGAWSVEEDDKLRAYIQTYGHWSWRRIPEYAGISRCGKSCRLRWMNYLRPGIKRGDYTEQEEDLIIKLHKEFGNKWSTIAEKLPGRTDNEIKNHWHTYMKKKRKTDQTTNQVTSSYQAEMPSDHREESSDPFLSAQESGTFASSKTTHEYSSSSLISVNHAGAPASTAMASCLADQDSDMASSSETLMVLDQGLEYSSTEDFWTKPFLQQDTYIQSNIIISEPYALFYGDGLDLFDQVMPTFHQDHA